MLSQKLDSHLTQLGYSHRLVSWIEYFLASGMSAQDVIKTLREQLQEIEDEVRTAKILIQRKPEQPIEATIGGICLDDF